MQNNVILMLLSLILLLSCTDDNKDYQEFYSKLVIETTFTDNIEINANFVNIAKGIKGLQGTTQNLLRFVRENRCLNYKIPLNGMDGELILTQNQTDCKQTYEGEVIAKLSKVGKLNIRLFDEINFKKKLRESLRPFELKMVFLENKRKRKVIINYVNLKRSFSSKKRGGAVIYKKYSSSAKRSRFPDLSVRQGKAQAVTYRGSLTDRHLDKNLKACRRVDSDCDLIGEDKCSECRYGSFEVVSFVCQGMGTRYCGPNNCGDRGEPACFRGLQYQNIHLKEVCFPGSPVGHCQKGLKTMCDENKILVCN